MAACSGLCGKALGLCSAQHCLSLSQKDILVFIICQGDLDGASQHLPSAMPYLGQHTHKQPFWQCPGDGITMSYTQSNELAGTDHSKPHS